MPYLNRTECENNFSHQYNTQPQGLGATRANLQRLLRSLDLVSWSTREESGRLDRKAFTRFAVGSTAVFARRQVAEAETSAVSILIDCSGSMDDGGRINVAESLAIQLARLLEKARVEFAVNGFRGNTYNYGLEATGATATHARYRTEDVEFIPFKTWKESLPKASAKLGSIHRWAGSATPDYTAISIKLDELASREEHRKIFFLLTDANGYDEQHMKHLQAIADKQGIKIIAIGIGHTGVKACFRTSDNVLNVADLASASFNKLLNELR